MIQITIFHKSIQSNHYRSVKTLFTCYHYSKRENAPELQLSIPTFFESP